MCKEEEETTNHLILFYGKAKMLWNLIYSIFGVQWVMHSSIRKSAWKAALLSLMWNLWKERNGRAFIAVERSNQAMKSFFMYTFVN